MSGTYGLLAWEYCKKRLSLQVLKSNAGFYIGTFDSEEGPCSRESEEYFRTREQAQMALDNSTWTQKLTP